MYDTVDRSSIVRPCRMPEVPASDRRTFFSYWISGNSAQWRVPIALQIVFAVIMIAGIELVSKLFPFPHPPLTTIAAVAGISTVAGQARAQRGSSCGHLRARRQTLHRS